MATVARDPKVGDVVYPWGKPVQAGVVTEVGVLHEHDLGRWVTDLGPEPGQRKTCEQGVRLRTQTGEVVVCEVGLADFRALIADHRKKLATHEAILARLTKESL